MLWFNYELKIETGNEKTQNKMPHQFMTLTEHFKTKYRVFFFSKEGKDLCHYSRGVQYKKH